ncbi:hypothetical protein [Rhodoflexus sp.]
MLQRQLNLPEIEKYARRFATTVCSSFFAQKDKISGQEIISLPIEKQVSLLIVKNIFLKWQSETSNLRSPFFDYTSVEVQKALAAFMNVVSKHISIARKHFEPLLAEAVQETLFLTLAPRAYFSDLLAQKQQPISVETDLKPLLKYFKVHRKMADELVRRMSTTVSPLSLPFAQELVQQIAEQKALMDNEDEVIAALARTLPLDKNQLAYITSPDTPEDPLDFSNDSINSMSFQVSKLSFGVENDEPPHSPLYTEDEPVVQSFFKEPEKPVFQPAQQQPQPPKEEPKFVPLNNRFASTVEQKKPSLNEVLARQQVKSTTVSDLYKNTKIQNMSDFIPLNQRYKFINELFAGSTADFNDALTAIDACKDYHEAIMIVKNKYLPKYGWDFSKDEVKEFYELIGRKF